jgi:hypothetical protein
VLLPIEQEANTIALLVGAGTRFSVVNDF